MNRLRRDGFARDRGGVAAIEFAIALPVLMLLVFGSYQIGEAVAAYRKVTLTANTVANLTAQYQSMASSDVSTVLNASAQIMAPFASSSLSIVLTEFTTDANGKTTVTWSQALNGTALVAGSSATLPSQVAQLNTSIVLANVSYTYNPAVHYILKGGYTMSSQMYMFPRSSQTITYTGS